MLRAGIVVPTAIGASTFISRAHAQTSSAGAPSHPFMHGVASGDPTHNSVILWTRVTPNADATPGSGVGPAVTVRWEVSTDQTFAVRVAEGSTTTDVDRDHTVKVDARDLQPQTGYFFRFSIVDASQARIYSPVGRTATTPAPHQHVDRLRFGVVSCSNWEAGYFSAYRHLADRRDLDAVLHLGDYLYEYRPGKYGAKFGSVREHIPARDIVTLADYRMRHGQYKTDADLQSLHQKVPVIAIWDDHESANDAWVAGAENHDPVTQGDWRTRYRNALQAYLEWMPIRPGGSGDRLYRRLSYGSLLELTMIDLRSYRDEPAVAVTGWRDVDAPHRSITGAQQFEWFVTGLTTAAAQWKFVGNPVMISPFLIPPLEPATTAALTQLLGIPSDGAPLNTDQWDGYAAERARLFSALTTTNTRDVVFLTGDIHMSWANELPLNAANYPAAGTVGVEFVVPSVTSKNVDDILQVPPRTVGLAAEAAIQATNNHVRFVEVDSHGYGVCEVTPDHAQMDWFFIQDPVNPNSASRHAHSLRTASQSARLTPAAPLDPTSHTSRSSA
ncbi:phosphodiesterase/alkaline phosphatase D [Hoyosella rhizosphaerae]|uniref:Phosphodiesterase/alkaline phosphatase D n=1 Tax=Hoyosella rhizosphaerae TaxID=1755582 RepID=A0A916U558_9ACTN|nr:phosphodiesterase/alkaline phosphatase D [Hoyosella rhizosphaerae]